MFVNETFGIYLIHWFVLNEIKKVCGFAVSDYMYRIPGGVAAFLISWIIVKVLRRIPIVKYIVP